MFFSPNLLAFLQEACSSNKKTFTLPFCAFFFALRKRRRLIICWRASAGPLVTRLRFSVKTVETAFLLGDKCNHRNTLCICWTVDSNSIFFFARGLVARVLMRTITEGSTSVMYLGVIHSLLWLSISQKVRHVDRDLYLGIHADDILRQWLMGLILQAIHQCRRCQTAAQSPSGSCAGAMEGWKGMLEGSIGFWCDVVWCFTKLQLSLKDAVCLSFIPRVCKMSLQIECETTMLLWGRA